MDWLKQIARRWAERWRDPYDPAKHYMRGAGPKSARKADSE